MLAWLLTAQVITAGGPALHVDVSKDRALSRKANALLEKAVRIRLPRVRIASGGKRGPDDLIASLQRVGGADWRFAVARPDGTIAVSRELQAMACPQLADLSALILERYLSGITWAGNDVPPTPPIPARPRPSSPPEAEPPRVATPPIPEPPLPVVEGPPPGAEAPPPEPPSPPAPPPPVLRSADGPLKPAATSRSTSRRAAPPSSSSPAPESRPSTTRPPRPVHRARAAGSARTSGTTCGTAGPRRRPA